MAGELDLGLLNGQEELDELNRRSTLLLVLDKVNGRPDSTAQLVLLVDALGLEDELADLVDGDLERHRRLVDVRRELEELAVAQDGNR